MKGIILAGGAGTRLYPLTMVSSKQLQSVFDKPMIYYPLTTLIENGVRDICVISTPQDIPRYEKLFGKDSRWGIKFEYRVQPEPGGIAQAFLIAESFIGSSNVALILGDNIFYGSNCFVKTFEEFRQGATIFGYKVQNPERYGVLGFDDNGKVTSITEKPKTPESNYAVPGLYLYDRHVVEIAHSLKYSARGELEITDINRVYLDRGKLNVIRIERGFAWLDAGTPRSLYDASGFVHTIEERQGMKIGCPEEAAFRRGFITAKELKSIIERIPSCDYGSYLKTVLSESEK